MLDCCLTLHVTWFWFRTWRARSGCVRAWDCDRLQSLRFDSVHIGTTAQMIDAAADAVELSDAEAASDRHVHAET